MTDLARLAAAVADMGAAVTACQRAVDEAARHPIERWFDQMIDDPLALEVEMDALSTHPAPEMTQ